MERGEAESEWGRVRIDEVYFEEEELREVFEREMKVRELEP